MKFQTQSVEQISSPVAWKALKNLITRFQFSHEESEILMGNMPRSTLYNGLSAGVGKLNRDQLDRISYLLGIYKALRILFTDSHQAATWILRENALPPFNGLSPKQFMLEGSLVRLAEVRKFLDFWRG